MALSYKIAKAAYDALPDVLKSEYEAEGDEYKLDLTGIDLKAQEKLDGERSKRRAAEKQRKEAEDKLQEAMDGDDRPQLVEKHTKELAKVTKRAEEAEGKFTKYVTTTTKDTAARTLARQLSNVHADLLLPHVAARLDVDVTDPMAPKVVVLDSNGAKTDKTLDDLRKDFVANKAFSGIVQASQASGGTPGNDPRGTGQRGTPGGQGFNPPPQNPGGQPRKALSDMSPAELAAHMAPKWAEQGLSGMKQE